jgi:hypothetical protein
MIGPCHEIFKFILLLLKFDLIDFFFVDELIALDA